MSQSHVFSDVLDLSDDELSGIPCFDHAEAPALQQASPIAWLVEEVCACEAAGGGGKPPNNKEIPSADSPVKRQKAEEEAPNKAKKIPLSFYSPLKRKVKAEEPPNNEFPSVQSVIDLLDDSPVKKRAEPGSDPLTSLEQDLFDAFKDDEFGESCWNTFIARREAANASSLRPLLTSVPVASNPYSTLAAASSTSRMSMDMEDEADAPSAEQWQQGASLESIWHVVFSWRR